MSLGKVIFNRENGNLGGVPTNEDGISAIIFYHTLATDTNTYTLTSLKDIEDAGYTYNNGTNGFKSLVNYQVSEYFKKSTYKLYVKFSTATPTTFSEITDLQSFSNGSIRCFGIYNDKGKFSTTQITAIQTALNGIELDYAPANALYSSAHTSGIAGYASTDLRTLNAYRVVNLIGDDLEGQAGAIRTAGAVSHVGMIGLTLGWLASIPVNNCVGQGDYNVVTDNFATPAFNDGSAVSLKSKTFLDNLDTFHHTFLFKRPKSAGTYHNFDYTSTADTDDFQQLSLNRVWDKGLLLMYEAYAPYVNRQNYLDPKTGLLSPTTITHLENVGKDALNQMVLNAEVSGIEVTIDPNQNVLATKTIIINATIVPTATGKVLSINYGFKPQL